MILIDPRLGRDLDPGNAAYRAKRPDVSPRFDHLPSLRALAAFLRRAQSAVRLRGQVSVLLTGDEAIRELNRRFRGKDQPTDVLSFPAAPGPENLAGDLAISIPTARKQAVEHGHPLGIEIKVLMLHGLLHLAGYDHEADHEEMARRERTLRKRLGLPLGLIERASVSTHSPGKRGKDGPRSKSTARKTTAGPSTRPSAAADGLAQDDKFVGAWEKTGPSTRSLRELAQDDRQGGRSQDDRAQRAPKWSKENAGRRSRKP